VWSGDVNHLNLMGTNHISGTAEATSESRQIL